MQLEDNYPQLEALVEVEDYQQAEALCLRVLDSGADQRFWRTQLGYVCFLNYEEVDSTYNRSTQIFQTLIDEYPDDANAHFWFAYIISVLMRENDLAQRELETVLRLVPEHPYTYLLLAGMGITDNEECISLLRKSLEIQPTNFRALYDLSKLLIESGRITDAQEILQTMLSIQPYVETKYGIMNRYINDVFTGAYWEEQRRWGFWRSLE